jgi:hypothetical protein
MKRSVLRIPKVIKKAPLACSCNDRESLESEGHEKNQSNETTERNRKRDKEDHEIGMGEISP